MHHASVKSPVRIILLLVAAALVGWHGVVLSTPHNHADVAVPQEQLACSASHPSSQANHLHAAGRLLSPHPCLACLAGSTVTETPGIVGVDTLTPAGPAVATRSLDRRSRLYTSLPLLRGPPLIT